MEALMEDLELVYCLNGHEMRRTLPGKIANCSACAASFSESKEVPCYSCSECNIMIHKKCVELPKQIDHPMHPEHPLVLFPRPPYEPKMARSYGVCRCQVCKMACRNFVYHCSTCEFDIDVLCAFMKVDIMISTHHHPVMLIPRSASFICNACDHKKNKEDESYVCTKPWCGFWIHKRCGSLPKIFQRPDHDHPLQLAVRMPHRYMKYKFACEICHEKFRFSSWIYFCQPCKYFIHVYCINLKPRSPDRETDDNAYPLDLVMIRELKTVTEHYLVEGESDYEVLKPHHQYLKQLEDRRLLEVNVEAHKHSLLLVSDYLHDDVNEVTCDGCIERIDRVSSPYYICRQHQCNFFLHTTCASLPGDYEMGKFAHDHNMDGSKVELHFPKNPWEALKCKACKSYCNGYGYKCSYYGSQCDFYLDIKCSYLQGSVAHKGHKHTLSSLKQYWSFFSTFRCGSCGDLHDACFLHCDSQCYLGIGFECATLPATVTHRWDKHTLALTFPPFFRNSPDTDEEFYCEVCEVEIHPKRWMYRCTECDQSFHPRCIPTLGECRNIKFGKTFRIQSHPHRLTLIPQAKLTSKCYYCRKSLNWSRAFECAPCGFYLCPDCIPKEELVEE